MAKFWFQDAQATWLSILVLLCHTCMLLYAQECWKKRKAFLLLLYHRWHFNWQGVGFCPPPPWLHLSQGSRIIKTSSWEIPLVYCLQNFYWIYSRALLLLKRFFLKYFLPIFPKKNIRLSNVKMVVKSNFCNCFCNCLSGNMLLVFKKSYTCFRH